MQKSIPVKRIAHALIFAVALGGAAGIADAQAPGAAQYAVIEGVASDSLHNDVLRDALLTVRGTSRSAITDAQGRFRIDSIPPGTWEVEMSHATLDTIGVGVRTPPLQLTAGKTSQLIVSVPSMQTVVAARCTPGERAIGPAAVLGTVQFAESENPAEGAKVILQYVEIRISRRGMESIPFRREATVAASGRFKFCALPPATSASLMAANGPDSTGSIGVRITSLVGLAGLELPDPTSSRAPRSTVSGRIVGPSGEPISQARVSIVGDSAVMLTDSTGVFALTSIRSGTRMLSVRRLGFEPVEKPVVVHAREPADLTVRLSRAVAVLDTVRIVAKRELDLTRVGFTQRKRTGTGYYMSPEQIERAGAYDLVSLLAQAPMLRRVSDNGKLVITGRGVGTGSACVRYYVDGNEWFGGSVEDFIRPDEISAIEAYSGTFTPPQFSPGMTSCETVLIWTKQRVK
jgi:hypothetical protein